MLQPFLLVGVGGSGGKTLRGIRHSLELRLQQIGWDRGLPKSWQMLHVDTPLVQDGVDYVMPFLPAESYLGLVASGAFYEGIHASVVHGDRVSMEHIKDVERQLPDA